MRNKDLLNKLKKNYTKIPMKLYQMDLPALAIALYCLLSSLPESFNPSLGFLKNKLFLSKPTVLKYLKILEARNIIKKYYVGGINNISKYEFIKPDKWK